MPDGTQPPAGVDDLASQLEVVRAQGSLPALAAAVWRGDHLIAAGVTGVRKLGDDTKATLHDAWHLGSDTKAITGLLIGIHVDRGVIRFDDTLAELYAGEALDAGYRSVTVLQLLQHRGGAPSEMPAEIWERMWADATAPTARIEAVRALLARPPAQRPGAFAYANAGYMIAGAALERRTGKTWEALVRAAIFEPLGMGSCGFGAPGTQPGRPPKLDAPRGHRVALGSTALTPIEPGPDADNPPSVGPAGSVHCALADWGKLLALTMHGARREPAALVSKETLDVLLTKGSAGDYAGGWILTERAWAGGLALTHSGSNTLWYATAWLAPTKNTTLAVVTNAGGDAAAAAVDQAMGVLIHAYLP